MIFSNDYCLSNHRIQIRLPIFRSAVNKCYNLLHRKEHLLEHDVTVTQKVTVRFLYCVRHLYPKMLP